MKIESSKLSKSDLSSSVDTDSDEYDESPLMIPFFPKKSSDMSMSQSKANDMDEF